MGEVILTQVKKLGRPKGTPASEEAKKKISVASKKHWQDPEYRDKVFAGLKNCSPRTPEHRKKLAASGKTYMTAHPEVRQAQSARMKQFWATKGQTPEYREKISTSQKEAAKKPGVKEKRSRRSKEIWARPEIREKFDTYHATHSNVRKGLTKETSSLIAAHSEKMRNLRLERGDTWGTTLGQSKPPEVVARQVATFKKNYAAGLIHTGGYPDRCKYTDQLGRTLNLRSSYEILFAKYLDTIEAYWEYEPNRFKLNDGSSYTPDFLVCYPIELQETYQLSWEFVEVKGYMTPENALKIRLFCETYPNLSLRVVPATEIMKLQVLEKVEGNKHLTPSEKVLLHTLYNEYGRHPLYINTFSLGKRASINE